MTCAPSTRIDRFGLMTSVIIAVPEARAHVLADELEMEGISVVSVVQPSRILPLPEGVDAAIVTATRAVLTPELIAECDRAGVRILCPEQT